MLQGAAHAPLGYAHTAWTAVRAQAAQYLPRSKGALGEGHSEVPQLCPDTGRATLPVSYTLPIPRLYPIHCFYCEWTATTTNLSFALCNELPLAECGQKVGHIDGSTSHGGWGEHSPAPLPCAHHDPRQAMGCLEGGGVEEGQERTKRSERRGKYCGLRDQTGGAGALD